MNRLVALTSQLQGHSALVALTTPFCLFSNASGFTCIRAWSTAVQHATVPPELPRLNQRLLQTAQHEEVVEDDVYKAAVPMATDVAVPLKAIYLGSRLDIWELKNNRFAHFASLPGRDHVFIPLRQVAQPLDADGEKVLNPQLPYMVAFRYGAVVLFNVSDAMLQQSVLAECQSCIEKNGLKDYSPKVDEYNAYIRPLMTDWVAQQTDGLSFRVLNLSNVRVTASVLAQSVALMAYEREVDRALEAINVINAEMKSQGRVNVQDNQLLRMVSENYMFLTDIITRVGILERSEAAWKYDRYDKLWNLLRAEFELNQRYDQLSAKINLIQDSAKYFIEVHHNRKSNSMELAIVVIILAELVVMGVDIGARFYGI